MKNKFWVILVLVLMVFLSPSKVHAGMAWSNGLDCEDEVTLDNGIVSKTCKINFEVTDSAADYNGFDIELTLTNMTVHSVTLEKTWKLTSQSSNKLVLESTDSNFKVGKHNVGTIVFYKVRSADICNVVYKFNFTKHERSCIYQDNIYYDKNGNQVSKAEFSRQCEPHKCDIVEDGDQKYYFDDAGKETDKQGYEDKCTAHYYCQEHEGKYYNNNGDQVDKKVYEKECLKHYCEQFDENTYFGKNGQEVEKIEYEKECLEHKCEVLDDGTKYGKNGAIVDDLVYKKECSQNVCEVLEDGSHFGKDGVVVDEATYIEQCEQPKCVVIGDKYYDNKGNSVTKEEYDALCGTIENPKTGLALPIAFMSIVTISGIYILGISKKHNKFM